MIKILTIVFIYHFNASVGPVVSIEITKIESSNTLYERVFNKINKYEWIDHNNNY